MAGLTVKEASLVSVHAGFQPLNGREPSLTKTVSSEIKTSFPETPHFPRECQGMVN